MKDRYDACQMQEETRGRLTSIGDIMLGMVSVSYDILINLWMTTTFQGILQP